MAVPIEAVRQAIDGPRPVAATGDAAAPIVVIEGVKAKPAVGWTVAGKHVATLWTAKLPAATAPHVTAKRAANGDIAADLGSTAGEATLFVIATAP
jgi:hypothetical protein